MAATNRLTFNKAFGKLDAVLPGSATTINAGFLASLPAISDPNFLPVVIGDGLPGTALEVVWVVAHADGSPTATVLRGQEGTDPTQVWDQGTPAGERITTWDLLLYYAALVNVPSSLHHGARALIGASKRILTKTASGLLGHIYTPPGYHGLIVGAVTGSVPPDDAAPMMISGSRSGNTSSQGLLSVPLGAGFPNQLHAFVPTRIDGGSFGLFFCSGGPGNTKNTAIVKCSWPNGDNYVANANVMLLATGW